MYAFIGRFMCSLGLVILLIFSIGTVSKLSSMRLHRVELTAECESGQRAQVVFIGGLSLSFVDEPAWK